MKVLYIYRSPQMGISIDNVFRPIEREMHKKCEVDSITFENTNYSLSSLIQNIITVKKYLKKHPDTIVHITGTENYLLPFLKKYKTVVTVHDLGFYSILSEGIKKRIKKMLFVDSLRLASKVTFISDSSFNEGRKLVDFEKNQCVTIENPVNERFVKDDSYHFDSECPTILQVGTKINNKNLERTAEALVGINCQFRIIGPLSNERKEKLNKLGLNFVQKQNLTNEEIIEEYQHCDIVSFASLYEGFGMPIIEGQAAGKAVVTSNFPPMSDVAAGSCVLVDPHSVDSIRKGIIEAIKNHEKYELLGQENVKRYSVKVKAAEYFSVYKEVMESDGQ